MEGGRKGGMEGWMDGRDGSVGLKGDGVGRGMGR